MTDNRLQFRSAADHQGSGDFSLDRKRIEASMADVNDLIVRVAGSLGTYPAHVELQRSFARLVGQRDALALHLARCV